MTSNFRAALAAAVILVPIAALAHEGATGIVKERMDAMEAMGREVKEIGRHIEANRNLADIGPRAAHIQALGDKLTSLFPAGSLQQPTDAKPEIWQNWDRFQAHAKTLHDAIGALQTAAAAGDPKALADRFTDLAHACSGCHEEFRQKKKR